jgi:hypothetical protein
MIVHFVGAKSGILDEITYYRRIITCVEKSGHSIAYDWVEDTYLLAQQGKLKDDAENWSQIDKNNAAGLSKADVIIIDATAKGFFTGYQASQAVLQKKPLMIMTRDDSPIAVSGLSTPTGFIKSVTYTEDNLERIIKDFLKENILNTKDLRFNFFLDRQTYNYLRWTSLKTGNTKAQIMRSLLQKEMDGSE